MVEQRLTASVISAVNLSDIMHSRWNEAWKWKTLRDDLEALGVDELPFDGDAAEEATKLRLATRAAGCP